MPYSVLMPIFADQILHGGAKAYGLLMGISGIGALAGAFTLALKRGPKGLGSWIAACVMGFGAGLIAFSLSRSFPLSLLIMLPLGYTLMVQMASTNTLIQMMIPDALRGRVMSVYSMMFMGMAPIGALLSGTLAHRLGAPLTVALGGGGCLAAASPSPSACPAGGRAPSDCSNPKRPRGMPNRRMEHQRAPFRVDEHPAPRFRACP